MFHACFRELTWVSVDTEQRLLVFQLVYPQDVKLTEKEVSCERRSLHTWVFSAVLTVCLWAHFGRKAASATWPSRTPTQVGSWSLVDSRGLPQELLSAHVFLLSPGCLGDTQFSFRFRQSVGRRALKLTEDVYNRDAPVSLQVGNCC